MDRWAAADLLRAAILGRFGSVEAGAATGLKLRHDGGSCFRSGHYQAEIEYLGIETSRSRRMAHMGALASITALLLYVTWRIVFTMPAGGWNLVAAWVLVAFEIFPVFGLPDHF